MQGIVGPVVLPILGAVPDGLIILFSGLGPKDVAEQQVSVGVGALAGSTVMLLTVPWLLSILGGRVPIVAGEPQYGKKRFSEESRAQSFWSSGVKPAPYIRTNALVMLCSCLICYLIVEVPALIYMNETKAAEVHAVKPFAWAGVVITFIFFVAYIALQYRLANSAAPEVQLQRREEETEFAELQYQAAQDALKKRVTDTMVKAIRTSQMSLRGVVMDLLPQHALQNDSSERLVAESDEKLSSSLKAVTTPLFNMFDTNSDGTLSKDEMGHLMFVLGEHVSAEDFERLFAESDSDGSGSIEFDEFVSWLTRLLKSQGSTSSGAWAGRAVTDASMTAVEIEVGGVSGAAADDEEEEKEEIEMPEDIRDMPAHVQRSRVLKRAARYMGTGTMIVILFSDPMVDVLDAIGTRIGVPSFFVAFLLGPLASNASEMLASYTYAQKKSKSSISVALSQLLGAACMNNTFCLFIFYILVAARGFAWTYHAEVAAIVAVQVIMCILASQKVQTVTSGMIVISLLPLSLALVAVLKATAFRGVEG
eukprot:TRINITY_DN95176_c0_g1_i1.p1 TRINITY_DN95176_c0_g1~~TRINITY_DN95176_c0_g1_i1.p1  ORF type:complete len:603 (-),score=114.91 TRINITY_DN95176_c0_g1_i1:25-1632(-)